MAASLVAQRDGAAPPRPFSGVVGSLRLGCFVTWRTTADGALRGCLGVSSGAVDLDETLEARALRLSVAAAQRDPRFPPIPFSELVDLDLGITLLGPEESWPAPRDPSSLEIGAEGLQVEHGEASGLLLPQVAVEWGYDGERFLQATCRKARLDPDAWQRAEVRVLRFRGQSLSRPVRDLLPDSE